MRDRHANRRNEHAPRRRTPGDRRIVALGVFLLLLAGVAVARLFSLQVLSHSFYEELAANAHDVFEKLVPARGDILIKDRDGNLYPIATNKDTFQLYAEPRNVTDPAEAARIMAPMLTLDAAELQAKMTGTGLYAPLARGVAEDLADQIAAALAAAGIRGIGMTREPARTYPEPGMGGHVLGFVGQDKDGNLVGRYGVEGYWEKELAGTPGTLQAETDAGGRVIPVGEQRMQPATDGADVVLTIDRAVQFYACGKLRDAVAQHGATGGSLIIVQPKTGDVIAMCGVPDYDPNQFAKVDDIGVFNDPAIFDQYEPGSIMKAITMAAAIDAGKVTPKTTYEDDGEMKLGPYTIKNSDHKAHGTQTMTQVLEQSLNTGAIFAERLLGTDLFRQYMERFGFGQLTGIELSKELPGDVSPLKKKGDIFAATASFGQGITATPIQMAMAYAAIADGGQLMKPRIVSEIRWSPTHVEERPPTPVRQVVSARAAALVGGMLVSVVENGHGKKAGVPGYWVAGKTGTAQIPRKDGPGYDPTATIGSFAGFAPVDDPAFVMLVRIDRPSDVVYAETTSAPVWGEIAKFLLQYYHVQPTRPVQ